MGLSELAGRLFHLHHMAKSLARRLSVSKPSKHISLFCPPGNWDDEDVAKAPSYLFGLTLSIRQTLCMRHAACVRSRNDDDWWGKKSYRVRLGAFYTAAKSIRRLISRKRETGKGNSSPHSICIPFGIQGECISGRPAWNLLVRIFFPTYPVQKI